MLGRAVLSVSFLCLAHSAWAGTYNISFDLADQVLPFDVFGNPPASVLAPAGVYQGFSDDTVMQILGGNLVASDPTGGVVGEYSALALVAEPPASAFIGGAVARCTIAGSTIADVRDGVYPGLAIGMTMVDTGANTYYFAAINRTTAGADYFDNITAGGATNKNLLTPGTGYIAVWETIFPATATVLAVQPIPAGAIADTEFRIGFDAAGIASFSVNGSPLLSNHALSAQPDRVGLVAMSWGTPNGNPAYSGVTFGSLTASGDGVPSGGVVDVPAAERIALVVLGAAMLAIGALVAARSKSAVSRCS
jgi:hypothetical protein